MKNRMMILFALLVLVGASRGQSTGGDVLQITLRTSATVNDTIVRLRDIAEIEGGAVSLRKKAAQLDLVEFTQVRPGALIPRDQVFYRLRLAGLEPRQFQIVGAAHVTVFQGQQALTREALMQAAEKAVRERLPRDAEEVAIRPAKPVNVPAIEVKPLDQVRLTAEVGGPMGVAGKVRVDVSIYVGADRKASATVYLDVSYRLDIAVARQRIGSGEVMREEHLSAEKRIIDGSEVYLTMPQCLGRKLRVAVMPGQPLTEADVDSALKEEPILIKARDPVRVFARAGAVRVTVLGEALQDGRAGQSIRVRNVDSNKIVCGKVIERGQVEVEY